MAHNLARWTTRIGLGEPLATTKTLRRRFFSRAGRITRKARRLTLHLPKAGLGKTSSALPWLDYAPFRSPHNAALGVSPVYDDTIRLADLRPGWAPDGFRHRSALKTTANASATGRQHPSGVTAISGIVYSDRNRGLANYSPGLKSLT